MRTQQLVQLSRALHIIEPMRDLREIRHRGKPVPVARQLGEALGREGRQLTRGSLPIPDHEAEERQRISPRTEEGVFLSEQRDLRCQLRGAILLATQMEEMDGKKRRTDQVVERRRERQRLTSQ